MHPQIDPSPTLYLFSVSEMKCKRSRFVEIKILFFNQLSTICACCMFITEVTQTGPGVLLVTVIWNAVQFQTSHLLYLQCSSTSGFDTSVNIL